MRATLIAVALGAAAACSGPAAPPAADLDALAEAYVRLVLAVGVHDADFVDAYYGPPEWRESAVSREDPLEDLAGRAEALLARLEEPVAGAAGVDETARRRRLAGQLRAVSMRIAMLRGARPGFDEESRALYDAVAPPLDDVTMEAVLGRLGDALPGEGSLAERYERWLRAFEIPPDRLDAVFRAAIEECRRRTGEHLALPAGESFELEYVRDKPWSGYNWYQGGYHSLIQVNEELPVQIERAVDLACHEGYPGHHAFNALIEARLVRGRGWIEYSVYPLFSPLSLIAEGTANYGIDVAFPGESRLEFERDVLFPLAGLDPDRAAEYREIRELASWAAWAGHDTARLYLDGRLDAERATRRLVERAMMTPERAAQRIGFFDRYRSYVINYTIGKDLVRRWVEAGAGGDDAARWARYAELVEMPRLPSELEAGIAAP